MPEINWELLKRLAHKPHPLLHIADDFEKQIREIPLAWVGEVFEEARTAHHLLDIVHIPHGKAHAQDLDARTYQAVAQICELSACLSRIASWHIRETLPGGPVGDDCNECGRRWPCDTWRMAEGLYADPEDEP